MINIECQYYST